MTAVERRCHTYAKSTSAEDLAASIDYRAFGGFSPEHVVYYMKEGGVHDFNAIIEYMYNALPLCFGDTHR